MIGITNTKVYGFDAAIRGMRNPLESWAKKDSYPYIQHGQAYEIVGENDRALMEKLASAGNDHGKFLRMINVTCDINAPLYWWKEFDTYKIGTVANSCSTMHKIQSHEFTDDMFSHDHLIDSKMLSELSDGELALSVDLPTTELTNDIALTPKGVLDVVIRALNVNRELYLKTKDKKYWWQMIQLLPSSFNQLRTVQLNYAVLKNIYQARKNHKLDEWHVFCDWIEELPEHELITGHVFKHGSVGKWITDFADNGWLNTTCSECGWTKNHDNGTYLDYDFCPHCGAKMK